MWRAQSHLIPGQEPFTHSLGRVRLGEQCLHSPDKALSKAQEECLSCLGSHGVGSSQQPPGLGPTQGLCFFNGMCLLPWSRENTRPDLQHTAEPKPRGAGSSQAASSPRVHAGTPWLMVLSHSQDSGEHPSSPRLTG